MNAFSGKRGTPSLAQGVALAALIFCGHVALVLLPNRGLASRIFLAALPVEQILAAAIIAYAAYRSARLSRRTALAWSAVALGCLAIALGNLFYVPFSLSATTAGSPDDLLFAIAFPLFLAGILLVPSESGKPDRRAQVTLDLAVVMIGSLLFFGAFLFGPLVASRGDHDLHYLLPLMIYPCGDLALLWALLDLAFRLGLRKATTLWLFAGAAAAMIWGDIAYVRQTLLGVYQSGGLSDLSYVIGGLLAGLAGIAQLRALRAPIGEVHPIPARRESRLGYLTYIWAAAAFALLVWGHYEPLPLSFAALAFGVGAIIILILGRLVLGITENARLYSRLLSAHDDLDQRVQRRTADLDRAVHVLQAEIVEREQAEAALRESENRCRSLLRTAERKVQEASLTDRIRSAIVQEVDLDVLLRTVVEGIAQIIGYTQVSLYLLHGETLRLHSQFGYDHVLSEIPISRGVTGQVMRTGKAAFYEDVRDAPDYLGAMAGIVSEICVPFGDGTKPVGLLNIESTGGIRLTEADFQLMIALSEHISIAVTRVRLRSEARESEERWQFALEGSGDGVWDWNVAEGRTFRSRRWKEMFGFGPDEADGTSEWWSAQVHPDDRVRVLDALNRCVRGEVLQYVSEYRFRCKDNSYRWVLDRAKVISWSPNGKAQRMVGTQADFTQLHEQEERLFLLRQAVDQAGEAVFITDASGIIQYVNAAFERIVGYASAEATGKSLAQLAVQGLEELAAATRRRNADRPQSGRLAIHRPDGSFCLVGYGITPLFAGQGQRTHWVGIMDDVTERQQLEEQFRQAQKMEAVGRLAGGVAHDFNNLLTIINGYSQLLAGDTTLGEVPHGEAQVILRAGERAAGLTRQLLAFSRRQQLEPRLLNINSVVQEMADMLQRLIGEHIRLELVLEESLGSTIADCGQLEQVVLNLVVNARDAMSGGGLITIETANADVSTPMVAPPDGVAPGRYVTLSVRDTGIGMSPEVLEHIFEPFFTTKERGKGTGLGLPTAYGVVRQSHGYLRVESAPGAGACFWVYLPRSEAETDVDLGVPQPLDVPGGGEHLLVVDDQEPVRRLTAQLLQELGYQVHEASSARHALDILASMPQKMDLVLTDIAMPEMTGWALVDAIHAAGLHPRIILTSGYPQEELQRVDKDSDLSFLPKPYNLEELARKVRQALER